MASMAESRFWESKTLAQLDREEWEALCDGCARCCLHKLQDEDSDEVFYTAVRCRYLDETRCRCTDYESRSQLVAHCVHLDVSKVGDFHWLPSTCAYRLLAEGQPLAWWHPLVSGSSSTVHEAGISIRGRCISDEFVHAEGYDEHIIHWVE